MSYNRRKGKPENKRSLTTLSLCMFRISFFKIHEAAVRKERPAASHKFPVGAFIVASLAPFARFVIHIPEDQTHFIFRRKGKTAGGGVTFHKGRLIVDFSPL